MSLSASRLIGKWCDHVIGIPILFGKFKVYLYKYTRVSMACSGSVTRWLLRFSLLFHLLPWKIAQLYTEFAKFGNNFCQILIKPSWNCQRHFILYQSGGISPNPATLLARRISHENGKFTFFLGIRTSPLTLSHRFTVRVRLTPWKEIDLGNDSLNFQRNGLRVFDLIF